MTYTNNNLFHYNKLYKKLILYKVGVRKKNPLLLGEKAGVRGNLQVMVMLKFLPIIFPLTQPLPQGEEKLKEI